MTLHRRSFLALALAPFLGIGLSPAAAFNKTAVIKSFRHSQTITNFACELFCYEDAMPMALRTTLDAECASIAAEYARLIESDWRAQLTEDGVEAERRCAAFFERLAVEYLAPLALRRAGCGQLAVGVANRMVCPSHAQHAIGRLFPHGPIYEGETVVRYVLMPKLAHCAYGACAHAATTHFYADHTDLEVVVTAGSYCARSLLDTCFYDDEVVAPDAHWVWNFAALAINAAVGIYGVEASQSPS
ncbi:MAG: hypothetical protein LCH61_10680 [Proteobacteria bacterium]|nr:hypothetical protein [Pseudomonadota bacterium]